MEKFDLTCTATLRPELLKTTFDSHIKYLFKDHIKDARLILNIDMIGSKTPDRDLRRILNYVDSIPFSDLDINIEESPSFSKAFCRNLGQIHNALVFNLEEDWEMVGPVDFEKMVAEFEDRELMHLRLSSFKSDASGVMKTWNKKIKWNGSYYAVPENLRGTIGWAGHPSLNRASFMLYFASILNPDRNPEKQIKGTHPIILYSKFGVFHQPNTPAIIKDLGRDWMIKNGYEKRGIKAFFTQWQKSLKKENQNANV